MALAVCARWEQKMTQWPDAEEPSSETFPHPMPLPGSSRLSGLLPMIREKVPNAGKYDHFRIVRKIVLTILR